MMRNGEEPFVTVAFNFILSYVVEDSAIDEGEM